MINILEFSGDHEYKHAWNISARICYLIYDNLDNCMLLYKYKLANHSFIFRKFGLNNPSRLNLEKLDGDSVFIFHLDIWKESTEEFADLMDYCVQKEIDVYISIKSKDSKSQLGYSDSHTILIRDILDRYDNITYDFTKVMYKSTTDIESVIEESSKMILRDIRMKKLLD